MTRTRWFVVGGLAVAALIAFFLSPLASSEPDGLERVAIDTGFAGSAADHHLADGPLAEYAVRGVDGPGLSTGLAGLIGVALCFLLALGLMYVVRWGRRRAAADRPVRAGSPARVTEDR